MAVDKNKIIAEATRLVQKGALDKAIAAYQKILAQDPKDVRILLKVGELYQKKNDARLAADAFTRVAETYADQGFFLKSVAVYKQIARLDPEDVRVSERLADLYQQLGLVSDATAQLQQVAAALERSSDLARLADVLRRMAELDPENVAAAVRLGELQARSGQADAALDSFRRCAELLKRQGRNDEYLKVAERIASLQPDDLALTRELAHAHLARGDTKRALARLQLCFKADPKDVETLNLLARAFGDLGQHGKTVSVFKELAHVHAEQGRHAEARATWAKVQELSPGDEDAAAALAAASAPAAAAPPRPPPRVAPAPPAPPPAAPPRAAPAAPAGPDAVAKLLAEADVYVKYGLHDRALEHLRKAVAADPGAAEPHERLRDLLAAKRPAEAADAAALAVRARLARGELELAREAISRLRQLAPGHRELAELSGAAAEAVEFQVEPPEPEEVLLEPDEAADDDALALAAAAHDGDEVIEEGLLSPAVEEGLELEVVEPEPEPESPLDEPAGIAATAEPEGAVTHQGAPPLAPPPAEEDEEEEEADLSEELDEVDFLVHQGLLEDARDALRDLAAFYPEHRGVAERLQAVEERVAAAAPPAPRPPAAAAPAAPAFDLARELAEEIAAAPSPAVEDDFQYSVDDVFNQFKKGVAQTVRPEDSATHYDLGIAYKEMGLFDDAVHELETALAGDDGRREIDCLTTIGACRLAQGQPHEAIAALRRALASPRLVPEAVRAVHYDLGEAHEAAGEREQALHHFQQARQLDPAFRDVAARVAALGGGLGAPPPDLPRPAAAPAPTVRAPPPAPPPPKKNIGYL